jgi:hypothetical protein
MIDYYNEEPLDVKSDSGGGLFVPLFFLFNEYFAGAKSPDPPQQMTAGPPCPVGSPPRTFPRWSQFGLDRFPAVL